MISPEPVTAPKAALKSTPTAYSPTSTCELEGPSINNPFDADIWPSNNKLPDSSNLAITVLFWNLNDWPVSSLSSSILNVILPSDEITVSWSVAPLNVCDVTVDAPSISPPPRSWLGNRPII